MEPYRCHTCQQSLPREAFANDRQKKDGRRRICRTCDAQHRQTRWASKREHERQRSKAYRDSHKPEIAARKQRYQSSAHGKQLTLAAGQRYRQTARGRTVIRAKQKRWEQTERGRLNARLRCSRRRALLLKVQGIFTAADWQRILSQQNNRCYHCKKRFIKSRPPTIDHIIPLTRGGEHSPQNIVAACRSCNAKKWNHQTHLL